MENIYLDITTLSTVPPWGQVPQKSLAIRFHVYLHSWLGGKGAVPPTRDSWDGSSPLAA